jgi:hypothetical protein
MIEHQKINGKDVWIEVIEQPVDRANLNTIPTEYFKARYYLSEPPEGKAAWILNDEGEPQLFESPVAALTSATKKLMTRV